MDVTCNVIEDLLPLYADGICSEDSKTIIEHHTAVCAECKDKLDSMTTELEKNEETPKPENPFKKLRFRHVRAVIIALCICVVITVPTVICGVLTANDIRGLNHSWSSMRLERKVKKFGTMLKNGEYREALDMVIIPALESYSESEASAFKDMFAKDLKNYFEQHPITGFEAQGKYSYNMMQDGEPIPQEPNGYLYINIKRDPDIDCDVPVLKMEFHKTDMEFFANYFVFSRSRTEMVSRAQDIALGLYDLPDNYTEYTRGFPDLWTVSSNFSERYFREFDIDYIAPRREINFGSTFFTYEFTADNYELNGNDYSAEYQKKIDQALERTRKLAEAYPYLGCETGKTEYILNERHMDIDRFYLQHAVLSFRSGDETITVECDVPFSMKNYPYRITRVRNIVYSDNTPDDFKEQFENIFAY